MSSQRRRPSFLIVDLATDQIAVKTNRSFIEITARPFPTKKLSPLNYAVRLVSHLLPREPRSQGN